MFFPERAVMGVERELGWRRGGREGDRKKKKMGDRGRNVAGMDGGRDCKIGIGAEKTVRNNH